MNMRDPNNKEQKQKENFFLKKKSKREGPNSKYQSIIRHSPTFFTNNRNISKTKQNTQSQML